MIYGVVLKNGFFSMFEIHILFDIQSDLFGNYKSKDLFRFNNLVILNDC